MPRTANPLSVSLIGAGKVGRTLSALLRKRGHHILSVITNTPERARAFSRSLQCPVVAKSVSQLPPDTNLLLIAVPDEQIPEIAANVSRAGVSFPRRTTAFHVSGSLTSDELSPLAEQGMRTFSLHPIQTFAPDVPLKEQVKMMKGIWYGFEGGGGVRPFARSLVADLGGNFLTVPKEQKILYHIACVFASNYPVALIGALEALADQLQMKDLRSFGPLMQTSIRLALNHGASEALTGPVSRGSTTIVRKHLEDLEKNAEPLTALYSAMGLLALRVAKQRGQLTTDEIRELHSLLSKYR